MARTLRVLIGDVKPCTRRPGVSNRHMRATGHREVSLVIPMRVVVSGVLTRSPGVCASRDPRAT